MENKDQDFHELRSLLAERAEMVPPCDLENGFISDLHAKIRSEELNRSSMRLFWERLQTSFNTQASFAWGGAGFAILLCAFTIGVFQSQNKSSELVEKEGFLNEAFTQIDVTVDFDGALPAFTSELTEF